VFIKDGKEYTDSFCTPLLTANGKLAGGAARNVRLANIKDGIDGFARSASSPRRCKRLMPRSWIRHPQRPLPAIAPAKSRRSVAFNAAALRKRAPKDKDRGL
jgi:hypothetical protein